MSVEAVAPQLLMSPPDYFEVAYRINPWMNPELWSLDARRLSRDAIAGWNALKALYERLGASVLVKPPVQGLPDLVFTANCAVVLDGKAVLARYLNEERSAEEAFDQRMFEQLKARGTVDEVHRTPQGVYFEGAGDAVFDAHRRLMWMGFGQRSSRCAHHTLEQVFRVPTVSLELVDPRYYHLDTCLGVLSGGEVLYHPGAFTEEGREQIEFLARGRLLAAPPEDAGQLAVNFLCIGRDVVMGHCSAGLAAQLQERGYRVHLVPLGSFNRSGGAACCLALALNHRFNGRQPAPQRLAA